MWTPGLDPIRGEYLVVLRDRCCPGVCGSVALLSGIDLLSEPAVTPVVVLSVSVRPSVRLFPPSVPARLQLCQVAPRLGVRTHRSEAGFGCVVIEPSEPSRMSGQSITDRITAAQHSVTGSAITKTVCKATTHEIMGPKKKHLDCKYFAFLAAFVAVVGFLNDPRLLGAVLLVIIDMWMLSLWLGGLRFQQACFNLLTY